MSTALRALMMKRDLDEALAALIQRERERDALQVREGELAEAIEAAESEEERDAVEQAVASFEQDRDETESAIQALAEKIAQAVQQISEIDEAQVVVNNGRALIAVRFDAQYSAGLDDRMKQQITETVQKVDDGLKDVEITDDDTLYGQIKGLGERVANVTGLDELADDFGDLWDRIVGR